MKEPLLIKKSFLTNRAIKNQKKILIISVICIITLFMSISYALLANFDKTDNIINFQTGSLAMTVNNVTVSLDSVLPQNDVEGLQNTTPIVLTLTNTGQLKIQKYDVKLIAETNTTNVSTLNEEYIKFAISEDGVTYSTPDILTTNNNIIYLGYNLEINQSKTIYLKIWLDENAGNDAINGIYYGAINVDLYQDMSLNAAIKSNILANNTETCPTYVEEDRIIYLSGTNECINFNYVWYSGKMWRITAINDDDTIKMITDDIVTSIYFNSNTDNGIVNFYTNENTKSYIFQWLNEDFLDTLYNYENIIVTDSVWNATYSDASSDDDVITNLPETTIVTSPVGLLNRYENILSYQNDDIEENGYLNINYEWWLLNPYSSDEVLYADYDGYAYSAYPSTGYGVRPSINLKPDVLIRGGTGTKDDPYKIQGDKEEAVAGTTLINTRTSGEYVTFNNELYRIVGFENGTTKINKNDYIRNESDTVITKKIASTVTYGASGNTQSNEYWDYYLNNTWYNSLSSESQNMLVDGTYYLGTTTDNYKGAVCLAPSNTVTTTNCEKTTITWTGKVGLLRYGEMFASQQGDGYSSSSATWLITPFSNSNNWLVSNYSLARDRKSSILRSVRPTVHLTSSIKIIGGS